MISIENANIMFTYAIGMIVILFLLGIFYLVRKIFLLKKVKV
jgi:hypothetical protein